MGTASTSLPSIESVTWKGTGVVADVDDARPDAAELELSHARRALALLKKRLPMDQLLKAVAVDVEESDRRCREWVGSGSPSGDLQPAVVVFDVNGMSADAFWEWFQARLDDEHGTLLPASPEHYGMGWVRQPNGEDAGLYWVVETFGGLPTHFNLAFQNDTAGYPVPADPGYHLRLVGPGMLRDGTVIFYIHHELKNTDHGCEVKTAVYFVPGVPAELVHEYHEHLTVEYYNWLSMACDFHRP